LPKLDGVAVNKNDQSVTEDSTSETGALSAVAQDYLKVIWTVQEWSQERVSTKLLSEKIGVSASTVSEAIRKLSDQGLVDHARYGSIALTEAGRVAAVGMVRRHRLIETYLVHELGYGWDEVHDEAEVLEHAVSDLMISRMDAKLGHPERDPHGDPIPAVDGSVPTPPARQLSDFVNGESGRIARISDSDPAMLRYLSDRGVSLGDRLEVLDVQPFGGPLTVRFGDALQVLGGALAAAMRVELDSP